MNKSKKNNIFSVAWRNYWGVVVADNNSMLTHWDSLLSSIIENGGDKGGVISSELLGSFSQGYPLDKLRLLLRSDNNEIVVTGIWITSELGQMAKPLLDDIRKLIQNSSHEVRFFALDCLITCAEPKDKQVMNESLDLLEDTHSAVRWKAMRMLTAISEPVIRETMNQAVEENRDRSHIDGLKLLLEFTNSNSSKELLEALVSSNEVLRKYAAIAIARLTPKNELLLQQVSDSSDADVVNFVSYFLR